MGDLQKITGVEIFESGEWNGDSYSENDLDTIVNAFNETKEITKPYLKLGHNKEQKLLANDGLPAAGYIDRIYKSGKKILADFVNIPEKIFHLIKNRAYKRVSSEIFVNFKSNGKNYPLALKAVALLGGDTPAVHTLNDIMSLGFTTTNVPASTTTTTEGNQTYTVHWDSHTLGQVEFESVKAFEMDVNKKDEEDNKMTLEESMRQTAKLEAENKSFQEENQALTKDLNEAEAKLRASEAQVKELSDKAATLSGEIEKNKKESFEKEVDAEIKAYQEAGKIVPAQAPFLAELLKNVKTDVKEFSIGEKKFSDVKSLVKGFIDAHVDIKTDDNKSSRGNINYSDSDLADKAKKYADQHKVSYKEALIAVSPAPESDGE